MARSQRKRSVWPLIFGLATGLVLILATATVGGGLFVRHELTRLGPHADDRIVVAPRGAGVIALGASLEAAGVIRDGRWLRVASWVRGGDTALKAGEYAVPAGASVLMIYQMLLDGEVIEHPITLAEGLTSQMIVEALEASDVLTGEIAETPAEGSLLPETYFVTRGTDRTALLARMAADQKAVLDALWPGRASDLPFSTREEAIILASIVEKETSVPAERARVAAVFVNRMRRGMRLETDPSIIYGITRGYPLGRGIRRSELDNENNLYNTYKIDGLPPTPIANPGRAAIAAVLNPIETDDLFFVADGSGGHAFASTYAEHQRNVARWRRIESEQR